MGFIKLYETKQYIGQESDKPSKLPVGDLFYAEDSKKLFRYNSQGRPKLMGMETELITQAEYDALGGEVDLNVNYMIIG